MSPQPSTPSAADNDNLPLKDPATAAFLAWLIPGLGHLYQGRRAKGLLFMVCILGTFLYGLFLGEGRVVYAAWQGENKRWPYLCQVGVGLPALPALVQASRVRNGKPPLFNDVVEGFMAPPRVAADGGHPDGDELDQLNKRLHRYFELGTVYTMIAGLLNVLAIYDAWLGPAYLLQQKKKEEEERESERPPPEPVSGPRPAA